MTPDERRAQLKQPQTVIITRSCRTKVNADSKIQNFEVGQEVSIVREFSEELISVGKAVVKDSYAHKQWAAAEEKKKKSREQLAGNNPSVNELLVKLTEAVIDLTEALKPTKKNKE